MLSIAAAAAAAAGACGGYEDVQRIGVLPDVPHR
jgi:hypothetical protein